MLVTMAILESCDFFLRRKQIPTGDQKYTWTELPITNKMNSFCFFNLQDKGYTALILAGYKGFVEILELLLQYGAEVNAITKVHYSLGLDISIVRRQKCIFTVLCYR